MWGCTCATCIILAFNRTLDLAAPNISRILFEGNRTFFWYIIPVLWGGYFILFCYPHVYTTIAFAFFFDPYYGINIPGIAHNDSMRPHYVHSTNNIVITICLPTIYTILCIFMICKTKKLKGTMKITPTQKMVGAARSVFNHEIILDVYPMLLTVYNYLNSSMHLCHNAMDRNTDLAGHHWPSYVAGCSWWEHILF